MITARIGSTLWYKQAAQQLSEDTAEFRRNSSDPLTQMIQQCQDDVEKMVWGYPEYYHRNRLICMSKETLEAYNKAMGGI